jgi:hypothetical protein
MPKTLIETMKKERERIKWLNYGNEVIQWNQAEMIVHQAGIEWIKSFISPRISISKFLLFLHL